MLPVLSEIAKFKSHSKDDNRGTFYFLEEGKG